MIQLHQLAAHYGGSPWAWANADPLDLQFSSLALSTHLQRQAALRRQAEAKAKLGRHRRS